MLERYTIKKSFGNNVIHVEDISGNEAILIGTGIGFNAKKGSSFIDYGSVKQKYVLSDNHNIENFNELVNNTNQELVGLVEEGIYEIQTELKKELNENLHVTLLDHINFAIDRHRMGLDFRYPFNANDQIRSIYPDEYRVASHLIEAINEKYQISLYEDEIGVVAIHIHAAVTNTRFDEINVKTEMIEKMVVALFRLINITVDRSSLSYQRVMLHCRYAYERILSNKKIENEMLDYIVGKYPKEFKVVRDALNSVLEDQGLVIPDTEIGYLVLYLKRLQEK